MRIFCKLYSQNYGSKKSLLKALNFWNIYCIKMKKVNYSCFRKIRRLGQYKLSLNKDLKYAIVIKNK